MAGATGTLWGTHHDASGLPVRPGTCTEGTPYGGF